MGVKTVPLPRLLSIDASASAQQFGRPEVRLRHRHSRIGRLRWWRQAIPVRCLARRRSSLARIVMTRSKPLIRDIQSAFGGEVPVRLDFELLATADRKAGPADEG